MNIQKYLLLACLIIEVNVAFAQAPEAPTNLTAAGETMSRIRLRWQDVSTNETSFIIERAKDTDENFVPIDTVGTDTTEYLNINLIAETTYFYRVKAVNDSGASAYSNTIGAATVPVTGLDKEKLANEVIVYPLPAYDQVFIDLKSLTGQKVSYTLYTHQGKLLKKGVFTKKSVISLKGYPNGAYLLKLQKGTSVVSKWLMKR